MAEYISKSRDEIAESYKAVIRNNLSELLRYSGLSQHELAEKTEAADGTLNNYIKGKVLPPLDFLAKVCLMPEFSGLGLEPWLLCSQQFDLNSLAAQNLPQRENGSQHHAYFGRFFLYYFDQSRTFPPSDTEADCPLRYGVLYAYGKASGEDKVLALVKFFETKDDMLAFSKQLDLGVSDGLSSAGKAEESERARRFFKEKGRYYSGEYSFTDFHFFISLENDDASDKALISLNVPHDSAGTDYSGGLGCVCSIAAGYRGMPVAQKILISRYLIRFSDEDTASVLRTDFSAVPVSDEAEKLISIAGKLGLIGGGEQEWLSEADKFGIFERRLRMIITDSVNKNFCSIEQVTPDDEGRAHTLIEGSACRE